MNGKACYVDPPADLDIDLVQALRFPDVEVDGLAPDRLVVKGPADQVQACLEAAYDRLVSIYYNVSSKKQKEEKGTYNFYYRRSEPDFIPFAKRRRLAGRCCSSIRLRGHRKIRRNGGQHPMPLGNSSGHRVGCRRTMPDFRNSLMSS